MCSINEEHYVECELQSKVCATRTLNEDSYQLASSMHADIILIRVS